MKILGVSRSHRFSPNSTNRDAAIFSAVADRLSRGANDVSVISEDLFVAVDLTEFDLVFSMARSNYVLRELANAEHNAKLPVFNSALSLLNASRSKLVALFDAIGIPQPATQVLHLPLIDEVSPSIELPYPLWLKRGDACAQVATDVQFVNSSAEMSVALQSFAQKGVADVVAVQHVVGDLVKFYGVEGTDFFSHSYPTDTEGFSKFGLEKYNGQPQHYAFSLTALKQTADKAARESGLIIYGGDAIVQTDGTFLIIDFNDWPSFASCRKEAAKAIAYRINSVHHV